MDEHHRPVEQSETASSPPTAQGSSPPSMRVPSPLSGPVTEPERIASIDVLRGFALLGILVLNIQSFAMIGAAYMNPTSYGDLTGANYWAWYFSRLLGDQKFMTIFSMLFGAGIVLMTSRAEQKTGRSAGVHYRRMAWLILFGLLHAHLLWFGDILYSYGMCGLVAYLFRKLRPGWLVVLALLAMLVPCFVSLGAYGMYHVIPAEGQEQWRVGQLEGWAPDQDMVQEELDAYRGSWLDQAGARSTMALFFETVIFVFFVGWRAGGLMLLGMALYKWGVFSAVRSYAFYAALAAIGIGLGVTGTFLEIALHESSGWPVMKSMYLYSQVHYWAAVPHSVGYVGLVMLLCKMQVVAFLLKALAAVGRMALTNYLMQTIICTTIFYGHGFGQFGSFNRVEQIETVALITLAQLVWSPIWLHAFRFGPFEWLWRSLTYWKLQPLRRTT